MVEDEVTCAFLLEEIRERLPLYDSVMESVMGRHVVKSRPTELFIDGAVMAFVPCLVVENMEFTSETLRSVYDLVGVLREQAGDCRSFECLLVFIDTGGNFSFYRMNTLCV